MKVNGKIVVEKLSKIFKKGNVEAVKGVSFEVGEGEFFAFLGPNGAGKSTTVQILTTLISPSSGRVEVAGYDVTDKPEDVRRQIGVALQETGVDSDLTGREMLELQAYIFGFTKPEGKRRAQELLELVDLTDAAARRIGGYSGGMRRRLDLALTLVNEPKILFLDEPTTGLDPSSRAAIWKELRRLNKEKGTTIFLTTQYLEEADALADRIGIINKGEIVAMGSPKQLKAEIGDDLITITLKDDNQLDQAMALSKERLAGVDVIRQEEKILIYVGEGTKQLLEVVRLFDVESIRISDIQLSTPTLDEIFLKLTRESKEEVKSLGE
ncbi:ATP-binding cassette domain-containing protein [Lysinibacillus sphaericus]